MSYMDIEGPDQPVHMCSLIKVLGLLKKQLDTTECMSGEPSSDDTLHSCPE